ncbi:hypothetical protein SJ978_14615, partial [Enterococcus faecium]
TQAEGGAGKQNGLKYSALSNTDVRLPVVIYPQYPIKTDQLVRSLQQKQFNPGATVKAYSFSIKLDFNH